MICNIKKTFLDFRNGTTQSNLRVYWPQRFRNHRTGKFDYLHTTSKVKLARLCKVKRRAPPFLQSAFTLAFNFWSSDAFFGVGDLYCRKVIFVIFSLYTCKLQVRMLTSSPSKVKRHFGPVFLLKNGGFNLTMPPYFKTHGGSLQVTKP